MEGSTTIPDDWDTPRRPLRARPVSLPRRHVRGCSHLWVETSSKDWNAAQRARCNQCVRGGPPVPEYTDDCPGCEDTIGYRQEMFHRSPTWRIVLTPAQPDGTVSP